MHFPIFNPVIEQCYGRSGFKRRMDPVPESRANRSLYRPINCVVVIDGKRFKHNAGNTTGNKRINSLNRIGQSRNAFIIS